LLQGAADLNTAPRKPGGCLMVQGALVGGETVILSGRNWSRAAWRVKPHYAGASSVRNQKVTFRPIQIQLILRAIWQRSSTEWQSRRRAELAAMNCNA
jgi:hypothetical protein